MENFFRIELDFFGIFIVIVVLWLSKNQIKTISKEHKVFLQLIYCILIELILDGIFWGVDGKRFFMDREFCWMLNTVYYAIQIISCYLWMCYCQLYLDCSEIKWKKYLLASPLILGLLFLVMNLWDRGVFFIDENNLYHRGWGVQGCTEAIVCMFYPIFCIGLIIWKMRSMDKKQREDGWYLLLVSSIPIITAVAQMLVYGLNFIWVGMAMVLLLILAKIEIRQYQEMQQQLTEQKIQIMLSQIQPHFLYNSLTAISYLCDENPKKAKKATVAFSKYLRGNLESVKQPKLISFEKELDHVKIYLSLEKMRFEEKLNVIYYIETEDFFLPALTVQPLVENAVKYGVGQKEEGGTIQITAIEEKQEYEVIISDDGVGFDPAQEIQDGRVHVGIENVRSRIMDMCGGTLTIESTLGVGTTVTIRIPKERTKDGNISSR